MVISNDKNNSGLSKAGLRYRKDIAVKVDSRYFFEDMKIM